MDATSVHAYGESTEDLHIATGRLKSTANRMSLSIMVDEARALGQPLYVGEAGTGTAHGNTDYTSIQKTLDGYVALGLQLVHWWSYDTCRQPSFGDDNDWNMNMTDFPESVAMIKAANEALKAKWLVNRADEDVTVTDHDDEAETAAPMDTAEPSETNGSLTNPPATENQNGESETAPTQSGCSSVVSVSVALSLLALAAYAVSRKKREE
jgi:hypothetical protein